MTRRVRLGSIWLGTAIAVALAATASPAQQYAEGPEAAALRVLDDYIAAYNARDEAAFVATLHFPHVRIAGDRAKTFMGIAEYMRELDQDLPCLLRCASEDSGSAARFACGLAPQTQALRQRGRSGGGEATSLI